MRVLKYKNGKLSIDDAEVPTSSQEVGAHERGKCEQQNTKKKVQHSQAQATQINFGCKMHELLQENAIALLAMREHSRQELINKLLRKYKKLSKNNNKEEDREDGAKSLIDTIIVFLQDNNYQSDIRFTESYIRSRKLSGVGPYKIMLELKHKGVERNIIESYIDAESAEWLELAQIQYKKKFSSKAGKQKDWVKRARFLASRGFSQNHIYQVVKL